MTSGMWHMGRSSVYGGHRGFVTVAPAWRLSPDERKRAISAMEARGILDDQIRMGRMDRLAEWDAAIGGRSMVTGGRVDGPALVSRVRRAVDAGQLLFLSESTEAPREAGESATDPGRIVRRAMKGRRHIAFEGAQYRLIEPGDWKQHEHDYGVVPLKEAKALLERMIKQPSIDKGEKSALGDAARLVTDRPVTATATPDGLFLVRRAPARAVAPESSAPASSPSRLAKAAEEEEPAWLEIVVVDPTGEPVEGKFWIELPDGQVKEGTLPPSGKIRFEDLAPGPFKLRLPPSEPSGSA